MSFVESLLFYAGNSSQGGFLHATVSLNERTVLNMTGTAKLCHVAGKSQQNMGLPRNSASGGNITMGRNTKEAQVGGRLNSKGTWLPTSSDSRPSSGVSQPCTCTYTHTQTQKYTHPQIKIKQQNLLRRIKIKQRLWNLTL